MKHCVHLPSKYNATDAVWLYFLGFVPNVQKYSQQTEVKLCDLHTEKFRQSEMEVIYIYFHLWLDHLLTAAITKPQPVCTNNNIKYERQTGLQLMIIIILN